MISTFGSQDATGVGGVPYVADGYIWPAGTTELTYSYATSSVSGNSFSSVISNSQQRSDIAEAFQIWGRMTGIKFVQAPDGKAADIRLNFADNFSQNTSYGDTMIVTNNHVIQPDTTVITLEDPSEIPLATDSSGQLYYNHDLAGEFGNVGFLQLALHEVGHVMGFSDNNDPNSIEHQYLTGYNRWFDQTDLAGIKAVYPNSAPTSIPAPLEADTGRYIGSGIAFTSVTNGIGMVTDQSTNDVVNLSQDTSDPTVMLNGDTTILAGGSSANIYANGKDTIYANAGNVTVHGGSGTLTFKGGSGTSTATLGDGGGTLWGGTGTTIEYADNGSASSILVGGTGNTTEFGAGAGNIEFVAGNGGYTIMAGQFGAGAEEFFTRANNTTLAALNGSNDTVIGGGGNSTFIAGTGTDIFAFLHGYAGGTEIIYNFTAQDGLAFGGYDGWPIATEQVMNGSDTMTLTDNTKITFVGLEHKIF